MPSSHEEFVLPKTNKNNLLGKYPGRTLHRIGVFLGSIWIVTGILGVIWPINDKSIIKKLDNSLQVNNIPLSTRPINIILIGIQQAKF